MAFNANASKANEGFSLKPEGEYEVIITEVKRKQTPNGAQSIGFKYVIRNDVEQHYKDGYIFHDVWKSKQPNEDDMMAEGYNYGNLMRIYNAAGLPDNLDYDSFDAYLAAFVGKAVRVSLYHDPYNGKIREKVKYHMATKFPDVKHKQKASAAAGTYAAKPAAQFAAAPAAPAAAASEADDDYPF